MQTQRVYIKTKNPVADLNIRPQYPIHHGKWVAHPESSRDEDSFCTWALNFQLDAPSAFILHLSADQRFELFCDGQFVGMGPDRADLAHWSFHSYELSLPTGAHQLTVETHFLHEAFPHAQQSLQPGMVLVGENAPVDLNTGSAPWKVRKQQGITTAPPRIQAYHVVGPAYTFQGHAYFSDQPALPPRLVAPAGGNSHTGCIEPGWKLFPSRLPEQIRREITETGQIRAVNKISATSPFHETASAENAPWQALIEGNASLTIPAADRVVVLWDLENYHCAYPEITLSKGRDARVTLEWAESCFDQPAPGTGEANFRHKGNRNEIDNKLFQGFGDTFIADGGKSRTFRPFWWRAGRYLRLTVEIGAEPLVIERIRLLETRLPLENESRFHCDDPTLLAILPLTIRGIQMCAHETYMDCPYYEQMMYVGDTRLQILTAFTLSHEDRLNKRALELFDWSRMHTGFVLERYPSMPMQLSTTFAMIWILMLRDFAWWRDDAEFTRRRLKGLRCLLEEFRAHQGKAPLLTALPGWSFIDWVPAWDCGYPPEGVSGTSGIVNLLFLNALQNAAELEDAFGDPQRATANREWVKKQAAAILETFWDQERRLFADDPAHTCWSEHAQCLALLSGAFPEQADACFQQLISATDLARATVYFSFYLLETFARSNRGDLILQKLDFWKRLVAQGFRTPVEMPEPSRSDCHAWGSHPLFHLHASISGIRPDAPGFSRVRITPLPGSLTQLESSIPHPAGDLSISLTRQAASWRGRVSLPPGITGVLVWNGKEYELDGTGEVELPQ